MSAQGGNVQVPSFLCVRAADVTPKQSCSLGMPTNCIAGAQADDSDIAVELLLAAARAMAPVIRRFISLGLNRVWLDAGDTVYQCALSACLC